MWICGSVVLVGPRPDLEWRRIRSLNKKVEVMLATSATTTAFQRVGSSDPTIGDFPAATGLAPFQGLKRSSGSHAPPTATVHRPRRDLEEGFLCIFHVLLGLSDYQGAADAFMEALRLDPESDEIKRALGEAMESKRSSILSEDMVNSLMTPRKPMMSEHADRESGWRHWWI
ncbi:hypothetical protein QYE76_008215 [Lolium multiflorum]|uniref:Uncharacterized protein n=1 Tax=Lolium multiflorum TaxID=4521 RepID=A0AAD8PS66_LOLMU|nr:hypothetical protein QYE76_008215 [Lolium multiflorum]